ncbi:hypothetical protein [Sutcliffiella halmapala]|uniref:hypothetical protein n=1 Tax=Sutcliffiella halmapala TaxID=79882 RepID=UPI000994906A|nr:hypothetical protein [Sutcliffiella halmapala]
MGIILYIVLILYLIGIGLIVMGLLFFFSQRDNKTAVYSVLMGLILIITGFLINENRAMVEGAILHVVEKEQVAFRID